MAKVDKAKYTKDRKYFVMKKPDLIKLVEKGNKDAQKELDRRKKIKAKKRKKKL